MQNRRRHVSCMRLKFPSNHAPDALALRCNVQAVSYLVIQECLFESKGRFLPNDGEYSILEPALVVVSRSDVQGGTTYSN